MVEIYKPSEQEYKCSLDLKWWTTREAFCILLGYPALVEEHIFHSLRMSESGNYLWELINRAIMDGSIQNLKREGGTLSGYDRAPCHDWIKWAMTITSIELDQTLINATGLSQQEDEQVYDQPIQKIIVKTAIVQTARLLLKLCPQIRVADIISVLETTKSLKKTPGEKTIRNYIGEAGLVLDNTKRTKDEIVLIERALVSFHVSPSD